MAQIHGSHLGHDRPTGHILFIDAYDSFSENIIAMLRETLSVRVTSIKIDSMLDPGLVIEDIGDRHQTLADLVRDFDAVVLGPGPGHPAIPEDVGIFQQIWALGETDILPVLGICLGFQSLCLSFGSSVDRLSFPCHGHVQTIQHPGTDIFAGIGHLEATNYHSLHVLLRNKEVRRTESRQCKRVPRSNSPCYDSGYETPSSSSRASSNDRSPTIPGCPLRALAWTDDNILMAAKHISKPFWGVQFHPESCKSNAACQQLITNWWHNSQKWNRNRGRTCRSSITAETIPVSMIAGEKHPNLSPSMGGLDPDIWDTFQSLTRDCTTKVSVVPIDYHANLPLRVLSMIEAESPSGMKAVLESTRKGQYSVFACPSPVSWRVDYWCSTSNVEMHIATCKGDHRKKPRSARAKGFEYITRMMGANRIDDAPQDLPFVGGFIGFLSYEMGLGKFESLRDTAANAGDMPADMSFLWVERCVILDHHSKRAWVQSILRDDETWLNQTSLSLEQPTREHGSLVSLPEQSSPTASSADQMFSRCLKSSTVLMPEQNRYKSSIQDCQRYLRSGDSYELCLTAETQVVLPKPEINPNPGLQSHAMAIYQRLRIGNPVPFASYLELGNTRVASASPEQYMTWSRTGQIDMIPMKGTVKKSSDMTFERACQILASPKEQAENLMIADLIRHDLYSLFSGTNRVEVVRLCDVVEHETVYQLVSHIRTIVPQLEDATHNEGRLSVLNEGHRALLATLPPGSMTGAPKKRSCEILSQLEKRKRSIYSGIIGYLDLGGSGAFSVCIRTAFCHLQAGQDTETWRIGAGGAITVLSDEEAEWEEMKTKLDSVLKVFVPRC